MNKEKRTIIFFDGICHLCNAFIDALIRRDFRHRLYFASLQGETAAKLLPSEDRSRLETVLVYHQGHWYQKSSAIILCLWLLGGWTKVFVVLKILPQPIRDFLYDYVAKRRYDIWGKRELCRLPEPHEREFLLP
jgi:predicted DCC family thiol-disulfide oxidoreductase YuxK